MYPHVGGPNVGAGRDWPNPVCFLGVGVAKGEPDGVAEAAAEPKLVGVYACGVDFCGVFLPLVGDGTPSPNVEVEVGLIASLCFLGAGWAKIEVDGVVETVLVDW